MIVWYLILNFRTRYGDHLHTLSGMSMATSSILSLTVDASTLAVLITTVHTQAFEKEGGTTGTQFVCVLN